MVILVYFVALGAVASAAALAVLVAFWMLRPNRSRVDPALELATWNAVADGLHNSNTDLIFWRDHFYLVHAASPFHLGSKRCRLVVRRSRDARIWETVAELNIPGEDIRDPKFATVGDPYGQNIRHIISLCLGNSDEPEETRFSHFQPAHAGSGSIWPRCRRSKTDPPWRALSRGSARGISPSPPCGGGRGLGLTAI